MATLFHRRPAFHPEQDIPDLSGRVIIVTGGNNGLGKESILQFAKHNPTRIYMGARSQTKAETALADIKKAVPKANVIFLELDLASFVSIKRAADIFLSENTRLDILMNNAGIMATPAGLTKDGYEIQFGTNHMGHALLTKLLLPILEKTAQEGNIDVRIVNLCSEAHKLAPTGGLLLSLDKKDLADISAVARYGQSKLANIYFTQGMTKYHPMVKSVAVHPGIVRTNIMEGARKTYPITSWLLASASKFFFLDVKTGALSQLWAAAAETEKVKNGGYYNPVGQEFGGSQMVNNKELSESLWEWTQKELKEHGF